MRFNTQPLDAAAVRAEPILFEAFQGMLRDILYGFQATHAKDRMSGRPGLAARSGALRRSWKVEIRGESLETLHGTYATTSRYARIHEHGGTIRPTSAKMLAVPLSAARTPAGVSRYGSPLRAILAANFPGGTFVQRTKSGALILFGKPTKDSAPVPLFVLKDSVTIPPRLGTRELWQQLESDRAKTISAWVSWANGKLAEAARAAGGGV